MPLPAIEPPLLNSANPWATTAEDIQKLFDCSHTGAVTTRTSLLQGFEHDDKVHQYAFFSPNDQTVRFGDVENGHIPNAYGGSLNTLGYSPLPLRSVTKQESRCLPYAVVYDSIAASVSMLIVPLTIAANIYRSFPRSFGIPRCQSRSARRRSSSSRSRVAWRRQWSAIAAFEMHRPRQRIHSAWK